ncbi:MAG: D-aminoacyl-tRNA deacylase [Tissierellia bacterium]|nr:D-aminoacyl-tRNA deacylase [Tissierellia bacterium]
MRGVVQRVKEASVSVDGQVIGAIEAGLLVLLGITQEDTEEDMDYMARKIMNLRIFDDDQGVMNQSVQDIAGSVLLISQFTLYGDARKGNRPSYIAAAKGEVAEPIYEKMVALLREKGISVATGSFGADMAVSLVNDGPVTILLDSERMF